MDELFAPPTYEWQRLSPRYVTLRQLTALLAWPLILSIPALLVGLLADLWWVAGLIWLAAVLVALGRVWFGRKSWRSWGYTERDEDLYITHGVWFRHLTAVPYGRMQLVEVESGPLERAFGLATVTLKTASPNTDARIPGLSAADAAQLRDRITALGESRSSGL
jgi:membrane protein YdbS with pleckstrin-like domain